MISYALLGYQDLDKTEHLLFDGALRARRNAQAPYSHYHVGAAVLNEKGTINIGCNVERANWTATTHAEQNAIDSMVTWEGSVKIKKLAFIGGPKDSEPEILKAAVPKDFYQFVEIPVPCGHCLQIIWENCHGDDSAQLYSYSSVLECFCRINIGDAFPFKFGPKDLDIDYSKFK